MIFKFTPSVDVFSSVSSNIALSNGACVGQSFGTVQITLAQQFSESSGDQMEKSNMLHTLVG